VGLRKPEEVFIARQMLIALGWGQNPARIGTFGNELNLEKFPQVRTGLSKTNVERWFSCVNLPQWISASELSNSL
jgi:hypothetical protein